MGENIEKVRVIALQVAEIMRQNPNTHDVHLDWNEKTKAVRLEVDQDKARSLGISSQQLSSTLNTLLRGIVITEYREKDELIEVIGRAVAEERGNLANLDNLNIYLNDGKFVPLSQICTAKYGFEEGIIWRRNRFPTMTVRADISDKVQAPDISVQINPTLDKLRAQLPPGYRIEMGGAIEESSKSQASIAAVMPFMLMVILVLLMIQLQSLQRTVLVLLTAPLGIIGLTLFLIVFQRPFGFVAMLGAISLMGMIMRNSVILIDQIEQDRAAGMPAWTAIVESTVRRFRPIMLTAAAAILAMIPLSHNNFWGPMAIAIMGGLLVATIFTLFFLPALYAAWFRVKKPILSQ
jgi:multidrug efflux pump